MQKCKALVVLFVKVNDNVDLSELHVRCSLQISVKCLTLFILLRSQSQNYFTNKKINIENAVWIVICMWHYYF